MYELKKWIDLLKGIFSDKFEQLDQLLEKIKSKDQ